MSLIYYLMTSVVDVISVDLYSKQIGIPLFLLVLGSFLDAHMLFNVQPLNNKIPSNHNGNVDHKLIPIIENGNVTFIEFGHANARINNKHDACIVEKLYFSSQ
jgi:hypothetical protein